LKASKALRFNFLINRNKLSAVIPAKAGIHRVQNNEVRSILLSCFRSI